MVDPCAAVLTLIVTLLLCCGIKEIGWVGYKLPNGYFPFGVDGMLAGSTTVFFAYIGFDILASTADETKNPKRDLPLGISLSLAICCGLNMLVSVVIVDLVPYMKWILIPPSLLHLLTMGCNGQRDYIITIVAVTSLISTLMDSIFPQHTGNWYSCCYLGILHGCFTIGRDAVSLLILRYIPPYEVTIPSSLQDSNMLEHDKDAHVISREDPEILVGLYAETRMLQLMFPLLKNKKLYPVVPSMKRTEGKSLAGAAFILTFVA
ncbi:hypothetical protein F3Y22_tig00008013pilonHSYRG00127 [Hibiscus syriacus]|uniref:Uncharacterized protein n=1 Tax=Hibiscus syriacus TaxID=106335 RepID=A0A6A3CB25_HIBSY|nr:hypothetical protein F3Y22_tig00008013pilonHSYRG00127 [Hibiscus syriacus]